MTLMAELPNIRVPVAPFPPPPRPGHPANTLTGKALIAFAKPDQIDQLNRWRSMRGLTALNPI